MHTASQRTEWAWVVVRLGQGASTNVGGGEPGPRTQWHRGGLTPASVGGRALHDWGSGEPPAAAVYSAGRGRRVRGEGCGERRTQEDGPGRHGGAGEAEPIPHQKGLGKSFRKRHVAGLNRTLVRPVLSMETKVRTETKTDISVHAHTRLPTSTPVCASPRTPALSTARRGSGPQQQRPQPAPRTRFNPISEAPGWLTQISI